MIDYLMAMGSVALIALGFIIQKVYQRATDSSAKSSSASSLRLLTALPLSSIPKALLRTTCSSR